MPVADVDPASLDGYEGLIAEHVAASTFAELGPEQQEKLIRLVETYGAEGGAPWGAAPAHCFTPDTDPRIVAAFEQAMDSLFPQRFQTTGRWSGNVASGFAGLRGEPITLTWSFIPDGTFIPSGTGEPAGPSNLFASLDSRYGGNTDAWQALYFEMFDRWGEITGINFIYEPNDDGVNLFSAPGVRGVRGDLRMGGKSIDGNSGTLAYNFFPNNGDMVLDTSDAFFNNTGNNSLALYQVLKHEHGHGMGLLHVCPIDNEKLMEPFINFAFQGAQHDDIRGAHFHYGDFFEPNDGVGNATDLGTLDIGQATNVGDLPPDGRQTVDFGSRASINAFADTDVYQFTVTERSAFSGSVTPIGFTYRDNPQNFNCTGNETVNSLIEANLRIEILDGSGVPIASSNIAGPGQIESINDVQLDVPGTYFVRVSATQFSEVQLYDLDFEIVEPQFRGIALAPTSELPETTPPDQPTTVSISINALDDVLIPSSTQLFFRANRQQDFTAITLTETETESIFEASLPAFDCGDEPNYYFSAFGVTTGQQFFPEGGPSQPLALFVGQRTNIIDLDFEISPGWFPIQTTASDGRWIQAIPAGGSPGAPNFDFDGSGQCWLTDNEDGDSDVDAGFALVRGAQYDITGGATVSWAYWLNDTPELPLSPEDSLVVQFSFNGGQSWETVRTYTQAANNWRTDSIEIPADQAATNFQFRMIATDEGADSTVEAALDAFNIARTSCGTEDCPGNVDDNDQVDIEDLLLVLREFGSSTEGDADGDGDTDIEDLLLVLREFGNTCP